MKSVTAPIIATSVVLLAVFIPVSFTGGITGKLFEQFAVTISVAVAISTINALTLSPALCAALLRPRKAITTGFFGSFNRVFDRTMMSYKRSVERLVVNQIVTAAAVAVIIVGFGAIW